MLRQRTPLRGVFNVATAKQRYLSRVLVKKHGIIGVVASRYVEAGYSVELFHSTRKGPVQILARKGGVIAVEVFDKGIVTLDAVKAFHEKTKVLRAKPVVVLYGSGVALSEEAKAYCNENGIKVKRLLVE